MKKLALTLCLTVCHATIISAQTADCDSVGTARTLGEVVVRGERPAIRGEEGILIVDLPAIVSDKPVTNVLESLAYLPGAYMNNDRLALAGATSLTIIINGEVQNMPADNLYRLLASIPVERLKKVEIMYAAPAKYHVSGTVVNVVLRTPSVLDGLQGQAYTSYEQTHYPSYSAGLSAVYATDRWTFDVNYSLARNKDRNHEQSDSRHTVGVSVHDIFEDNYRTSRGLTNTIYASGAYKINEESKLQLTYNGQIKSKAKACSMTDGTMGHFINRHDYTRPVQFHDISIMYQSGFGLKLRADYTKFDEHRRQLLYSGKTEAISVGSQSRQDISRCNLYADQTHQSAGWTLNYGIEYRYASDKSSQTYSIPERDGFSGRLKELGLQAYVGTSKSFDCGFSFSASVAEEYYKYGGSRDWNFVPQLGLSYRKTPASIFLLNFTSERVYPSYWEIHGGTSYLNDYSMIAGNPDLKPYMEYATQFTYIFRQKYMATLFYHYKDRYSVQLPYQMPDRLQLIFQTLNLDYDNKLGIHLHIPFQAGKVYNSTLSIQSYFEHVKSSHFHDIAFDRHKLTAYVSLSNTLRLSTRHPLSLTVDASCISPSLQGPADMSALWRLDAGLKWSFAGHNAELTLKCNDIFDRWSPTMRIKYETQDYRMKIYDMTQKLKLSFVWRFNGFKPKDDTVEIDTSRFGTGK